MNGAPGLVAGVMGEELAEVVEHGLHFAGGVGVVGASGSGEAGLEAGLGFFAATGFEELLGGHLVGGDVVGRVCNDAVELGECLVRVAFGGVGHGEAVAGEGVGGVVGEDFG